MKKRIAPITLACLLVLSLAACSTAPSSAAAPTSSAPPMADTSGSISATVVSIDLAEAGQLSFEAPDDYSVVLIQAPESALVGATEVEVVFADDTTETPIYAFYVMPEGKWRETVDASAAEAPKMLLNQNGYVVVGNYLQSTPFPEGSPYTELMEPGPYMSFVQDIEETVALTPLNAA